MNFLQAETNKMFQMPGLYDGAMSDECKELFWNQCGTACRRLTGAEGIRCQGERRLRAESWSGFWSHERSWLSPHWGRRPTPPRHLEDGTFLKDWDHEFVPARRVDMVRFQRLPIMGVEGA